MKRRSVPLSVWLIIWLLAALVAVTGAWAKPTTPEQARTVVRNWLGLDAIPLGASMGRQVKEVQTFYYEGTPAYYVVYLKPAGMVFVPADDLVEPIIGFLPEGVYDPSPTNPLGALVSRDIPGRVLQAREVEAKGLEALAPDSPQMKARRKWDLLTQPTGPKASEFGVSSISDVRVASLVQSRWGQSFVNGQACYNYYIPLDPVYPGPFSCGAVATAMAQIMRYWQYPTDGIGVHTFQIQVEFHSFSVHTRGGDGSGGPYDWANMELDPLHPVSPPLTLAQRQAIGALTYDAGITLNTHYGWEATYADPLKAADSFTGTFGYSNAKRGYNHGSNLPETNRNAMVNPNLHAGYPILFGITGFSECNSIVCDGYGYNSSTMYHHLNLGWSGAFTAWYNLPTIDTERDTSTNINRCVYNVYPSGSGEIIAGRVTNSGSPLSGVTLTASGTGGPYTTTTDANGIYALAKVPSDTAFTITASKTGYDPSSQAVTTGTSINDTTITGNQWPIDFTLAVHVITLNEALDNFRLSFSTRGSAYWYGERAYSYFGGSAAKSGAIADSQSSSLRTTVVGPGTLSFSWKVSSEPNHDCLNLLLDTTLIDCVSGSVDWTRKTVNVPTGIHIVTWQYVKDSSGSQGSDCGWIDEVFYTGRSGIGGQLLLILLH